MLGCERCRRLSHHAVPRGGSQRDSCLVPRTVNHNNAERGSNRAKMNFVAGGRWKRAASEL